MAEEKVKEKKEKIAVDDSVETSTEKKGNKEDGNAHGEYKNPNPDKKDVYKEISHSKNDIHKIKHELNKVGADKEEIYKEKEKINRLVISKINQIKKFKIEREKLDKKIIKIKEERKKYNQLISSKINEFKELDNKKKSATKGKKVSSPGQLKQEIAKLEEKIEIEALAFNKEKQITKIIKSKKKELKETSQFSSLITEMRELSGKIDDIKKNADEKHKEIQELAKQGQEIHLKIRRLSKEIDILKKDRKGANKKFSEIKKKFGELNELLKEGLLKINIFSKKISKQKNEKKEKIAKKKKLLLKDKEEAIGEKVKKGKKLTTEDLLVMQQLSDKEIQDTFNKSNQDKKK